MDRSAPDLFIFGGSFDPVHKGHVAIIREVHAGLKNPASLLLMPTNASPFKENRPALADDRLAMLNLAFENENLPGLPWQISRLELDARESARTIDTLQTIEAQKSYAERRIWLIIGADHISQLENWKRGSDLLRNYSLVVARRPGIDAAPLAEDLRKKYGAEIWLLDGPDVSCSSSQIRQFLLQGQLEKAAECLPQKVLDFIVAHKLYGSAA